MTSHSGHFDSKKNGLPNLLESVNLARTIGSKTFELRTLWHITFFQKWAILGLFFYLRLSNTVLIKFADDWIRTEDL